MAEKKQPHNSKLISSAKEVFSIEANAIQQLTSNLTTDFSGAVTAIKKTKGRLIITGMGKSGIIGKKIAATFTSTGTPSVFLHPAEAIHGDLGMITSGDIVLAISYSGETEEMLQLLPYIKERKIVLISMTGNPVSTLAKHASFHLNVYVKKEACPLQLAPTSSTTATLVMGDALAVTVMKEKNFQPEDFASLHPGGSLGKRLITKVEHLMLTKNLPIINATDLLSKVIPVMSSSRLGIAIVCSNKKLLGIITDGDLRRAIEKYKEKLFSLQAQNIMTKHPKTIRKEAKVMEAEKMCNDYKITSLLVTDNKNKVAGVFQIYNTATI